MDQNVRLELTVNQVNIILAGLAKLPLETSLEAFSVVRQQVEAQIQPTQAQPPSVEITE